MALIGLLFCALSAPARAGEADALAITAKGCAALSDHVNAIAGDGPVFLRSYDDLDGRSAPSNPAQMTAAYIYDNALATIALTACGRNKEAKRIATAIAMAAAAGPLYNVYLAGPQTASPPPNGWTDKQEGRWFQDDYQVGTASGNVAWAGLALLTVYNRSGESRYLEGAQNLGHWIITRVLNGRDSTGFAAGFQRVHGKNVTLERVSTEENADLAAMFAWLSRKNGPERWSGQAARALAFVATQWDGKHFRIGTLADGRTANTANSALDCQTLPLLLPDHNPQWDSVLGYMDHVYGVDGGFDYNDDRDGVWLEGTAQAALAFRIVDKKRGRSDKMLSLIAKQFSPGGYIWATTVPRLTTGLEISPASTTDDLYYFRMPHLGATAWAVLAATGWNPYTGEVVP